LEVAAAVVLETMSLAQVVVVVALGVFLPA
jgi:hypothetical protein